VTQREAVENSKKKKNKDKSTHFSERNRLSAILSSKQTAGNEDARLHNSIGTIIDKLDLYCDFLSGNLVLLIIL
jgi:hypothetical protein